MHEHGTEIRVRCLLWFLSRGTVFTESSEAAKSNPVGKH